VTGWVLTLPAAAATAGIVYAVIELFGNGAVGAVVVSVALAVGCVLLWRANRAARVAPEESVAENVISGPAPAQTPAPVTA